MNAARQFCDAIDACYESSSRVTVTLYAKLPHSITTFQPGLNEWLAERNKEGELTRVIGLGNVTRDFFDRAVNVQLDIRPDDDSRAPESTFGHLECKGLLSRHLVYYVQPGEVGVPVKNLLLSEQRLSKMKFGVGNGFERCHSVSMS